MSERYVLGMFPYPSGRAHMGHVRVYTITDTVAAHVRKKGHRVLHPMGFDAFGLPAENAAIRQGVRPEEWTASNIATLRATFQAMGWSFDWDREIDTSSPDYYRHTQQIFLWLWEQGLAHIVSGPATFCPSCATVLADEQVSDGCCWRCGASVQARHVPQWTLKITAYAQRLWDDLSALTDWDPRAVAIQRRWIGRTEGRRAILRSARGDIALFVPSDAPIRARAVLIAPEHDIARSCEDPAIQSAIGESLARSRVARASTPPVLLAPAGFCTEEGLPVWISDAVVPDHGVMASPYLQGEPHIDAIALPSAIDIASTPAVAWHLRDWSVGRQRRWGCPIPMVHCPRCGVVPVPTAELPVRIEDPLQRPCPACGVTARRESDTLDTFVCSAWYAFRFTDPRCESAPFRREAADRWMPVDLYVGGLDHTAQHMLYFRFVTKFLYDRGQIGFHEPVLRFVCNGLVRNADGQKMSKSGRGVDPADLLQRYSASALKLAILADVPVERDLPWDEAKVANKERFLVRFAEQIDAFLARWPGVPGDRHRWPNPAVVTRIDTLITGMDRDISRMALHNAVAKLHTLHSVLQPVLTRPDAAPDAARGLLRAVLDAASVLVPDWAEARWPAAPRDEGAPDR